MISCPEILELLGRWHSVIRQRWLSFLTKIQSFMGNASKKGVSTVVAVGSRPRMHFKCREEIYPRGDNIRRFPVPDDQVPWSVHFPEYAPVEFTSDSVAKQPPWADLDFKAQHQNNVRWNELDGKIDRRSHTGMYEIVQGLPRNPVGRTGICARGTLGRWGPNHAADPIVTRWRRNNQGEQVFDQHTGRPILQFIAIKRRDSGQWAIPGGMVDAGEKVSVTLKREFTEEAMNSLQVTPLEKLKIEHNIQELFSKGIEIYRGYVDDPRNTDNSWMETVAVNFHDDVGESVGRMELNAGDDAVGVQWTDINSNISLFASHCDFVRLTAQQHGAHW